MRIVLQTPTVAVVEMDSEFYVYSGSVTGYPGAPDPKLVRVCPSEGMAREVAAAY